MEEILKKKVHLFIEWPSYLCDESDFDLDVRA